MSNLIITVISIALISIAAIATVYYGGAAFENAQAKAYANAIAQQAVQINNAITQWQVDNGGASFVMAIRQQVQSCSGFLSATYVCTTAGYDPIANVLTPNWLQSMTLPDPTDLAGVDTSNAVHNRWEFSNWNNLSSLSPLGATVQPLYIWLYGVHPITSTAVQICNQVAMMARGPNAVPFYYSSWSNVVHNAGENPAVVDCLWDSDGGSSQINNCVGSSSCQIFIAVQVNAM